MLNYDFIFKNGVLFIILKGKINSTTTKLFNDEINPLVLDNGIKNVVLDISNLKRVEKYEIKKLYDSYSILKDVSNVFIVGLKERKDDKLLTMRN